MPRRSLRTRALRTVQKHVGDRSDHMRIEAISHQLKYPYDSRLLLCQFYLLLLSKFKMLLGIPRFLLPACVSGLRPPKCKGADIHIGTDNRPLCCASYLHEAHTNLSWHKFPNLTIGYPLKLSTHTRQKVTVSLMTL